MSLKDKYKKQLEENSSPVILEQEEIELAEDIVHSLGVGSSALSGPDTDELLDEQAVQDIISD
ncbi:MAG: hypothetical protein KAS39_09065, partial [Actinomycetia bacterium]|nr:hypothetical protein [Actinomycetes bacterium]